MFHKREARVTLTKVEDIALLKKHKEEEESPKRELPRAIIISSESESESEDEEERAERPPQAEKIVPVIEIKSPVKSVIEEKSPPEPEEETQTDPPFDPSGLDTSDDEDNDSDDEEEGGESTSTEKEREDGLDKEQESLDNPVFSSFEEFSKGACRFECKVCAFSCPSSAEFWSHAQGAHGMDPAGYRAGHGDPCVEQKRLECTCYAVFR